MTEINADKIETNFMLKGCKENVKIYRLLDTGLIGAWQANWF